MHDLRTQRLHSCKKKIRFARFRKFTHEQYQSYLLQCRRSYRTLLLNAQAVQEAEATAALTLGPMHVLFSYFCFSLAKSLVFLVASFLLPCKCEEIRSYQDRVADILASTRIPFRQVDDSLFPKLRQFMEQFKFAKESLVCIKLPKPRRVVLFCSSLLLWPACVL